MTELVKISSCSVGCSFVPLRRTSAKDFQFHVVPFSVELIACALDVLFGKLSLVPKHSRLVPNLLSFLAGLFHIEVFDVHGLQFVQADK